MDPSRWKQIHNGGKEEALPYNRKSTNECIKNDQIRKSPFGSPHRNN